MCHKEMDTLFSLKIFCQIVETGSFTKAADRLDISTAMVSKHINALETRLNVRLLHRNTRSVSLTEQGEHYYQSSRKALETLADAENALAEQRAEPQGLLKIVAPLWFANPTFTALLAEYQRRYPKVRLELNLKNREQEALSDTEEVALRVNAVLDDNLIARKIADLPFHFVAAPDYLNTHGTPQTLDNLADHHGILPNYAPLKGIRDFHQIQPHQWFHTATKSNNTLMLHQLTLANQGIAVLPNWLTESEVAQGKLQRLLPDLPEYSVPLYAVYQNRSFQSLKVRTWIDFLVGNLGGK